MTHSKASRSAVGAGLLLIITTGLVLPAGLRAAEPRDYSKGFDMFYKLGLPDCQKAGYVKLDVVNGGDFSGSYALYSMRLAGNAWLIEEKDGTGRFIADNCRVIEVRDYEKFAKERAGGFDLMALAGDGAPMGKWTKASLKDDVQKTLDAVKKFGGNKNERSSLEYSDGYGALLLMAVHFHRQGFANEANEIVGALFEMAGNPKKVIQQALHQLADGQYNDACDRFFKARDWKAFGADLDALLGKFSADWKNAPAVKRLADAVKRRASQTQAPEVAGEGLTAEDTALAGELANSTGGERMMYGENWLMAESPPAILKKSGVIERIQVRGLKSIPLLLALLKDDYLTAIDPHRFGVGRSYSFGGDDSEMSDEMIERAYANLRRPASRGEIAAALLRALLPRSEQMDETEDRAALYDEAQKWLAKLKDKSPIEIARVYLSDGDETQKHSAIERLTKTADEKDIAAIEKYLIDSVKEENSGFGINSVQQYVMARGPKARDFLEKYAAAFKEQSGKQKDATRGPFPVEDLDKMIDGLKEMTSDKSARDVLAEIASGKKSVEQAATALFSKLGKEKPDDVVGLILGAAVDAPDVAGRGALLQLVLYAPMAMAQLGAGNAAQPGDAGEPKLDIKAHVELWRKLLDDTRKSDETFDEWSGTSIGDTAASYIEMLYSREQYQTYAQIGATLGTRILEPLRKRARARLDGKAEIPAWPAASDVTAQRRKEIADQLTAAGEDALPKLLAALTPSEILALSEEKSAPLAAKLRNVAHRVTEVKVATGNAAEDEKARKWKGEMLTKEKIEALFSAGKAMVQAGRNVIGWVRRDAGCAGITINLAAIPEDKVKGRMSQYFGYFMTGRSGVFAWMHAPGFNLNAVLPVEPPKEKKTGAKTDTEESDELPLEEFSSFGGPMQQSPENFLKKVEEFLASDANVPAYAQISIVGAPAKKNETQPPVGSHIRIIEK
jgi:hypothetical protein